MSGKLFCFMDFQATDFTTLYPDITPGIGGVWFARWDQFNPAEGEYNFSLINNWLEAESKNFLKDGTPKPLIAFLLTHTAPTQAEPEGIDYTPSWVKAKAPSLHATKLNGSGRAVMPAYNNYYWWGALRKAVEAFTYALDGKPQVAYISIAHGCDGELWTMNYPTTYKLPGGVERMFGEETISIINLYRSCVKTTPLLVRATPGSGHKSFNEAAFAAGIGTQMCGAQDCAQNAEGWGREYGTWTSLVDAHANGLPAVAETASGNGSPAFRYRTILGMIGACHIDAMDVHPEWLSKVSPEIWNWAIAHMNVTAATSPSAWWCGRDFDDDYPPIEWKSSVDGVLSGQSDWRGDFNFYLKRTSSDDLAPRVFKVGDAADLEYGQCRRITRAVFEVDPNFPKPPYFLSIRWHDETGSSSLVVDEGVGSDPLVIEGDGTVGHWRTDIVTIKSRTFEVSSTSKVAVHMLELSPIPGEEEPPPPPPPEPGVDWSSIFIALNKAENDISDARDALDSAVNNLDKIRAEASKWGTLVPGGNNG